MSDERSCRHVSGYGNHHDLYIHTVRRRLLFGFEEKPSRDVATVLQSRTLVMRIALFGAIVCIVARFFPSTGRSHNDPRDIVTMRVGQ